MMRLAIVATPGFHRDQRPAPGSLDGDLIRARLSLDDAGFRVVDVDPARDLAEQLDALFDELAATRKTLVDAEEAARDEASSLFLFYASSAVALSPEGELFLCLDPENPGMGDALGDIAAVFRDRARGAVLFVIEGHHGPGVTSRDVVTAAERAVAPDGMAIELLVAAHPIGEVGSEVPSVFTRAFVEHLDEVEPERGLTAEAIFRRVERSPELAGAIPCFARVRGRGAVAVLAPREGGSRAASSPEAEAPQSEVEIATTPAPAPDDPVAQYLAAGDTLAAAWDLEGALTAYKKALALVGAAQRDARAEVHLRIGYARWRQEKRREAIASFEKALSLAPEHRPALEALVELHLAERDFAALRTAEERLLSRVEGDDDRLALLVQYAERWEVIAGDLERAREVLERARELRPDDAAVLRGLDRLYGAAGDVDAALDVRSRLVELVEDPRQKAQSLLDLARATMQGEARATLSEVTREQTGIDLLERALDADPTLLDPLALIAILLAARQEWGELELVYRRMLDRAQRIADPRTRSDVTWEVCRRLGLLFRDHLEDPGSALEAFEGAVAERPDDIPGRLSAASLARSAGRLERAAAHLQAAAVLDPGNVQVFHDLFDTFQKLRRPDQSWAAASVAVYLGAAEARERFVFEEHRPAGVVQPAHAVSPASWELLRAADRDRALEEVLASIAGAAIRARLAQRARERKLPQLDPAARADAERNAAGVVRLFSWASRCLGMPAPAVYLRKDAPIGVAAVLVEEPSVLVGGEALRGRTAAELAFLVGSHVAYHVGPHRLLLYFPTLEELGVCLAAAVKLARPAEPVPAELEAPVLALMPLLDERLTDGERDALEASVFELYEIRAPLDLAHWVGSVERCAARVGYLLTGDLSVAASSLSRADAPGVLTAEERIGDLVSFTVSDAYHALRKELGVAIEPWRALQRGACPGRSVLALEVSEVGGVARRAAEEAGDELTRLDAASLGEHLLAEVARDGGVQEPFLLEAGEHVARERQRPLVAVVARIVGDEVPEARLEVRPLDEGERLVRALRLLHDLGRVEARVAGVELQIDRRERELPLRRERPPEAARPGHRLEEAVRDLLARRVVLREQVEHLARPRPLLEHLARRLDEVAHGRGPRVGGQLRAREEVVQHVPELVEEGHHVLVGHERRLRPGLREVALERRDRRLPRPVVEPLRRPHREHRRVFVLVGPAVEVEVELPDHLAAGAHLVRGHVGVPGVRGELLVLEAVHPRGDVHEPPLHRADLEVVRERLRAELVLGRADAVLQVVALGGRELVGRLASEPHVLLHELGELGLGGLLQRGPDLVEEGAHGAARLGHPRLDRVVGPALVAEQLRLLGAEREQPIEQLHVLLAAAVGEQDEEVERGLAVLRVGDEREEVGVIGGDLDLAVRLGRVLRRVLLGQALERCGRDLDRAGRRRQVRHELLSDPGDLLVQVAQALLSVLREREPVAAEVAEHVGEEPGALSLQGVALVGVRLEDGGEVAVQPHCGGEPVDLRLAEPRGLAHGRVGVGDAHEVREVAGAVHLEHRAVEPPEGGGVGELLRRRPLQRLDRAEVLLRRAQVIVAELPHPAHGASQRHGIELRARRGLGRRRRPRGGRLPRRGAAERGGRGGWPALDARAAGEEEEREEPGARGRGADPHGGPAIPRGTGKLGRESAEATIREEIAARRGARAEVRAPPGREPQFVCGGR
ncbi:uncharacterized protein SOCE26_055440 [Sorangium cellulosum]|uniref:Tetratricopeptide repeat protein n=1 Tax=Sorangium cellulosum TaxID=56 RepID=A0A2L0EXP9_SORCE|nr:uncharacterized protein SOCE26_055440 [Sorangium cellulosum]